MQLYNDIFDIPTSRLDKIQQNLLRGVKDYSPLVKKGKARKRHSKKLYKQYEELLYQFPKVDISLNKAFQIYDLEMQKYQTGLLINEYREQMNMKPVKVDKYPANKAFSKYFELLKESYTDIEFEICFLNPKIKKIYKAVTGKNIPVEFEKYLELEFFHASEFIELISKFGMEFKLAMLTGYGTFVKSEKRLFSDDIYGIEKINDRLEKHYRAIGGYNKWFIIRYKMFNLHKLNFRAKEQQTILSEVITMSKILQQDIDIEKVTVGQLFTNYREMTEKVIRDSQSKPDGHAG